MSNILSVIWYISSTYVDECFVAKIHMINDSIKDSIKHKLSTFFSASIWTLNLFQIIYQTQQVQCKVELASIFTSSVPIFYSWHHFYWESKGYPIAIHTTQLLLCLPVNTKMLMLAPRDLFIVYHDIKENTNKLFCKVHQKSSQDNCTWHHL